MPRIYLRIILRFLVIAALSAVAVGITAVYFALQKPLYQASVRVLSDSTSLLQLASLKGIDLISPARDSSSYKEIVLSDQVFKRAINNLALTGRLNVNQFRQKAKVRFESSTAAAGVYVLTIRDVNPERASLLVNGWARAFVAWDTNYIRSRFAQYRLNLQAQQGLVGVELRRQQSSNQTSVLAYLQQAQGQIAKDIQLVRGLEQGGIGTLSLLDEAVIPTQPIPLNARLVVGGVGLAAFFLLLLMWRIFDSWVLVLRQQEAGSEGQMPIRMASKDPKPIHHKETRALTSHAIAEELQPKP